VQAADKKARKLYDSLLSYKQFATMPDGTRIGSKDGQHWYGLTTGQEVK
jgi:hypothetical protein